MLDDAGDARLFHRFEHAIVGGRLGQDFPILPIILQIFATRFENDVHQIVFLGRRLGDEISPFLWNI